MKNKLFISLFVFALFGCFVVSDVLAQDIFGGPYRKPSQNDVDWLLGRGKTVRPSGFVTKPSRLDSAVRVQGESGTTNPVWREPASGAQFRENVDKGIQNPAEPRRSGIEETEKSSAVFVPPAAPLPPPTIRLKQPQVVPVSFETEKSEATTEPAKKPALIPPPPPKPTAKASDYPFETPKPEPKPEPSSPKPILVAAKPEPKPEPNPTKPVLVPTTKNQASEEVATVKEPKKPIVQSQHLASTPSPEPPLTEPASVHQNTMQNDWLEKSLNQTVNNTVDRSFDNSFGNSDVSSVPPPPYNSQVMLACPCGCCQGKGCSGCSHCAHRQGICKTCSPAHGMACRIPHEEPMSCETAPAPCGPSPCDPISSMDCQPIDCQPNPCSGVGRFCVDQDIPDMVGDAGWVPDRWLIFQGYPQTVLGYAHSQPTMLLSRLNVAEHFNAEVRDRIWFDYRHFNNAVESRRQVGPISGSTRHPVEQFTLGWEKRFFAKSSLELRIPIFYQVESGIDGSLRNQNDAEMGDLSVQFKHVFCRTKQFTLSGGLGVTCPTGENWKCNDYNIRLQNKEVDLVPWFGFQWRPNDRLFGHGLIQFDIPIKMNEIEVVDTTSDIREQTLMRIGLQVGRWFYRNEQGSHSCRLGGFVELDYTAAMTDAPFGQAISLPYGLLVGSPAERRQSLSAVVGMPIVFGNLSITNALMLPLMHHDRQFSVGYNFSISRRF